MIKTNITLIVEAAYGKGYDVVNNGWAFVFSLYPKAEQDLGVSFARVDADTLDKIIAKEEDIPSKLDQRSKRNYLKPIFEDIVEKENTLFKLKA